MKIKSNIEETKANLENQAKRMKMISNASHS